MEIRELVELQREWFEKGKTRNISFRIGALKTLKNYILSHEDEINAALAKDLKKSYFETYMCETGLALSELNYMLKHLRSFAGEHTVYTPLAQFHARSYTSDEPYGVVLVMSPWNYPFMLTMNPVIGAIAAGNCVVIKPSAYAPATSDIIEKVIRECFPPEFVSVVKGGRAENTALLDQRFDFIFFTGSVAVGREVMNKASANLTPVCLELGGKSPCIVDASANLKLAAKRIVFGKYLNLGQTCVAPDYLFVHKDVEEALLKEIEKQIAKQFGANPLENPDYGRIINEKHFKRISSLMESGTIRIGGQTDPETLRIAPTVLTDISPSDPVMQQEIFGPLLPVMTYQNISEVISYLKRREKPLALYLFTSDRKTEKKVMNSCSFGGGCVNDTVIHLATSQMGFGGVGGSGMGRYHGRDSFELFSNRKSIVKKYTWMDMPIRYQPYTNLKYKLLRLFVR